MGKRLQAETRCATCGRVFLQRADRLKRNSRNFCSPECKRTAPTLAVQVSCEICGKTVVRYPSQLAGQKQVFCSVACRAVEQRRQAPPPVQTECSYCGAEIEKQAWQYARAVEHHFCAVACLHAFQKGIPSPKRQWVECVCDTCGTTFERKRSQVGRVGRSTRNFCSEPCFHHYGSIAYTCSHCGQEFREQAKAQFRIRRHDGKGQNERFCSLACRNARIAAELDSGIDYSRMQLVLDRGQGGGA